MSQKIAALLRVRYAEIMRSTARGKKPTETPEQWQRMQAASRVKVTMRTWDKLRKEGLITSLGFACLTDAGRAYLADATR